MHALLIWRDRVRRNAVATLAGKRAKALAVELSPHRRARRRLLRTTAVAAGIFALAQPLGPEHKRDTSQHGLDIAICLDVSRSMRARDLAPDRLQAAQQQIRTLVERAAGDRFALIAFAGEARLLVPLTRDWRSLADLADACDPTSVGRGGTDLAAALASAQIALQDSDPQAAAILLLTDGEDFGNRGLAAARTLGERGLAVHTIVFGTIAGSKIAIDDGGATSFLRGPDGQEVISVPDRAALQAIADAAGGTFVSADHPRALLQLFERQLLPMARRAYAPQLQAQRTPLFPWLLGLALLLLALELATTSRQLGFFSTQN